MKKVIGLLLALLMGTMSLLIVGCSEKKPNPGDDKNLELDDRKLSAPDYSRLNLACTDALGRKISKANGVKSDKIRYVGLFYSLWLGQHPEAQTGIYDITSLMNTDEGQKLLFDGAGSKLSKTGEFHFWGEPLYGYYNMKDPWVVSRHIELLTMAGIDYLCFDATNDKVYNDATDLVLNTLLKFQSQGFEVPKFVFYTNSNSGMTVDKIYSRYYQTEKYQNIWFAPNGKPLIIGITENNHKASDQTKYDPSFKNYISKSMQDFFDVKESEWPNGDFNKNSIPWMSWDYPQKIHNGSISVPVAQHSHSRISVSYRDPECSRGYDNRSGKKESNFRSGKSFQTMWDNVFDNDRIISNVLLTSFNEWMAIKQNGSDGVSFVDVFDEENSRDIEMMKGGYNDNFLLQMIQNVRKYKYTAAKKYLSQKMTIDIENSDSLVMWDYVTAAYKDFEGDSMPRNFSNAAYTGKYIDHSNRNDITDIKVVRDDSNLTFMVKTAEDVTMYNGIDVNWMNLLIKTNVGGAMFEGYRYIINRNPGNGKTSIERSLGGYKWERVGDAKLKIQGNILLLSIPLASLDLTFDNCSIEFKVCDNVTHFEDIMDYYCTGDSAPLGRLNFSYD